MSETESVVDLAAARQRAHQDLVQLNSNGRLERIVTQLQAELVAQWLKEPDQARRERCWNECRALEVILGRLTGELLEDLGLDDEDPEVRNVVSESAVGRAFRRVEDLLWREPWQRWSAGIRRWRTNR